MSYTNDGSSKEFDNGIIAGIIIGLILSALISITILAVTPPDYTLSHHAVEACQFAGFDTAMVNADGTYCVTIESEHVKFYTD